MARPIVHFYRPWRQWQPARKRDRKHPSTFARCRIPRIEVTSLPYCLTDVCAYLLSWSWAIQATDNSLGACAGEDGFTRPNTHKRNTCPSARKSTPLPGVPGKSASSALLTARLIGEHRQLRIISTSFCARAQNCRCIKAWFPTRPRCGLLSPAFHISPTATIRVIL